MIDLILGDCRDVLPALGADSLDACVTDPPYGWDFMGKGWDHGVPGVEFWRAVARVLRPGAVLLAFGGPRTYHRLTCAVEDAGFLIEDSIHWVYGQGFPKHKSKLKPAHEPIVVARKPGPKWLGVESCRVDANEPRMAYLEPGGTNRNVYGDGLNGGKANGTTTQGRWPTNLAFVHHPDCRSVGTRRVKGTAPRGAPSNGRPRPHGVAYERIDSPRALIHHADPDGLETVAAWECVDGCPIRLLDEQAGERKGNRPGRKPRVNTSFVFGWSGPEGHSHQTAGFTDSGSASRFYPTFAWAEADDLTPFLYCPKASRSERGHFNNHPTVKPLEMTRWLLKLACPAGGTALDPFLGSGTTAVACVGLGLSCVGIDDDPDSHAIAGRRVEAARAARPLFA